MRSSRPSIAELRAVCQPPEVMDRYSAEHWAGRLYMRRLSIHVTRLALRAGIGANAMTFWMALIGVAGAACFAGPGLGWAVAGALLIQAYLLIDCSDGEVARWNDTASATGIYLDRLGHYLVEAALLAALGWRAGHLAVADLPSVSGRFDTDPGWLAVGLAAAVLHLLGKVETDLVHVARAKHGLPPLADTAEAASPRSGAVARLRRLAGRVPLYRLTGAVELSALLLAAAVADAATGGAVTRPLGWAMLGVTAYVFAGHLAMILASNRLRG